MQALYWSEYNAQRRTNQGKARFATTCSMCMQYMSAHHDRNHVNTNQLCSAVGSVEHISTAVLRAKRTQKHLTQWGRSRRMYRPLVQVLRTTPNKRRNCCCTSTVVEPWDVGYRIVLRCLIELYQHSRGPTPSTTHRTTCTFVFDLPRIKAT